MPMRQRLPGRRRPGRRRGPGGAAGWSAGRRPRWSSVWTSCLPHSAHSFTSRPGTRRIQMSDTAGWLASNGIGGPTDYHAYGGLLARRQAEQAERDAERAEERRLAGLEEARDQRLTAQYLA